MGECADAARIPSEDDEWRGSGTAGPGAADVCAAGAVSDLSQRVVDRAVSTGCRGHRWRGGPRHRALRSWGSWSSRSSRASPPATHPGAGGWDPTSSTGHRSSRRRPTSTSSSGRSRRCPAGRTTEGPIAGHAVAFPSVDLAAAGHARHSMGEDAPPQIILDAHGPGGGRRRRGRGSRVRSATGTATARHAATPRARRAWQVIETLLAPTVTLTRRLGSTLREDRDELLHLQPGADAHPQHGPRIASGGGGRACRQWQVDARRRACPAAGGGGLSDAPGLLQPAAGHEHDPRAGGWPRGRRSHGHDLPHAVRADGAAGGRAARRDRAPSPRTGGTGRCRMRSSRP